MEFILSKEEFKRVRRLNIIHNKKKLVSVLSFYLSAIMFALSLIKMFTANYSEEVNLAPFWWFMISIVTFALYAIATRIPIVEKIRIVGDELHLYEKHRDECYNTNFGYSDKEVINIDFIVDIHNIKEISYDEKTKRIEFSCPTKQIVHYSHANRLEEHDLVNYDYVLYDYFNPSLYEALKKILEM